jgi:eukaryotic-like serine/threonine-protein kinase
MRRPRHLLVILATALAFASMTIASAAAAPETDWPQFHFDPAHTGHNPNETTLTASNVSGLNRQWTTAIGPGSESSPAVVGDTVFVGADDANLYAVDAATGAVRWTAPTAAAINLSSPAVADGRVFIGSLDQVYAFDASTGAQLWNTSTGGAVQAPPTVANGVVYAASDKLYAFDPATGQVLWTADTGGPVLFSAPTVVGGKVYAGGIDPEFLHGVLRAFDATTGDRLWTATTFGAIEGAPVVVGDTVYLASGFGIQAFDASTGATLWGVVLESNALNTPAVVDGVVYVASELGRVDALNAATGASVWSTSIRTQAESINFSSPAIANGVLYVGSSDAIGTTGQVWALDTAGGSILWSAPVGAWVRASLAVVNGRVYVSADRLYAFGLGDSIPPEITVPGDITTVTSDPAGAVVSFDVSVTDNADPNPQVTCDPASGSTFPIGETTVTCTATDSAGNTATASFKVTVLRALDISVQIDRSGSVNPSTGVATVRGTVSCNRATSVAISGELRQTFANRVVIDGFFSTQVDCAPPASAWSATVTASNGRYGGGPASVSVSANACDPFSCDFDTAAREITLRAKR